MTRKKDKPKFEIIRKHLEQELEMFKSREITMTVEIEDAEKQLKGAIEGLRVMRLLISQIGQFLKTEGSEKGKE